ncbi:tryptophan-rich sensory protein [Bacillus lacus]|uniref:Tryptophan-rich sensory protein n=1 Tax=Metabacillus lacus TaxID=1983721 RepID=A0A7X2LZG9_9BACI|nr:tryptophan-rich sensory protein [Metabacillus lacus]MRX71932.1 tryptophan-rich sensory protein [Metabacillus lacus]
MRNNRVLAIVNLIFYIIMVAVNYLANALPINDRTTGDISDSLPIIFEPAGYAFSIWSLIYILLGIWVIKQFFAKGEQKIAYLKVGFWFAGNAMLNSLWILAFHYEMFIITLILMAAILITLIVIYSKVKVPGKQPFLLRAPISIYMGWISVASIVNVFIFFYTQDIESFLGLSEFPWVLIMLAVGGVLALFVNMKEGDILYPLVFIWAYIAIIVKEADQQAVAYTALTIIVLLAARIVFFAIKNRWKN